MLHFFSITVFWSLIESIFLKTEHFTVHTKDKIEKDKAECDVKNKKTQQSAKVTYSGEVFLLEEEGKLFSTASPGEMHLTPTLSAAHHLWLLHTAVHVTLHFLPIE